jgi:anti-anti-sigma regulatory factor
MTASAIRFCQSDTTITFQVDGRVTMAQSVPFRRLAEQALDAGVACLYVDLRRCLYIDSTFVGTLLVLQRAARDRAAFAILCPSAPCQRVLDSLGLGRRFAVIQCDELPAHAWTEVDVTGEDRACLRFNVCESHQELVNVGGRTAEPFRAVAASLQRELEAERRTRSDG